MADNPALTLESRNVLGKAVKNLRKAGLIPVHLYGPGIDSLSLQCQEPELIKVLTAAGGNTPITITVAGEKEDYLAFVREIQWDPVLGSLVHVDFLRAQLDRPVTASVPIVLEGESPGARESQGTPVQHLHSLEVEALPLEMPSQITVDLSTLMEADSETRVGDIVLPPGATLITDPNELVVRIEALRAAAEAELAELEEAAAEAAEGEPVSEEAEAGEPAGEEQEEGSS